MSKVGVGRYSGENPGVQAQLCGLGQSPSTWAVSHVLGGDEV